MTPQSPYGPAAEPVVAPSRTRGSRRRILVLGVLTFGLMIGTYVALTARSAGAALLLGGLLVTVVAVGLTFMRRLNRSDLAAAAAATGLRYSTDQRALLAALPAERVDHWYRMYPLNVSVTGGLQGWYRGSPVTYVLVEMGVASGRRPQSVVRLDLPVVLPRASASPRLPSQPAGIAVTPPPGAGFHDRYEVDGADPGAAARLFTGPLADGLLRCADAGRKLSVSFDGPVMLVSAMGIASDAVELIDTAVALRDAVLAAHR